MNYFTAYLLLYHMLSQSWLSLWAANPRKEQK